MSGTIEIGAVELFVRVAELRSFRAAGDVLGVPRSTVSRRIAELEKAMKAAARELDFERAARLRDELRSLRELQIFR